jgi:hypothetical protein
MKVKNYSLTFKINTMQKATFVRHVKSFDSETNQDIVIDVYKLENGKYFAIETTVAENWKEPVYSPYDREQLDMTEY